MMAHIALHSRSRLKDLDEIEALEIFAMLPAPKVAFDDWCKIVGADLQSEEEKNESFIKTVTDAGSARLGE